MKIRNGFVSNSSTSSFIITSDKKGYKLNIQNFILRILKDPDISQHYNDKSTFIENIKSIKNDSLLYNMNGKYDETEVLLTDNKIIFRSSNHYGWYDFLSKFYEFDYNEDTFYDNWNSDDKPKSKIYDLTYGVAFDDIDYDRCTNSSCDSYSKKYFYSGKMYCPQCQNNILISLNRVSKLKKILA